MLSSRSLQNVRNWAHIKIAWSTHRESRRFDGKPPGRRFSYPRCRYGCRNDDLHEVPDPPTGLHGHVGPGKYGAAIGAAVARLMPLDTLSEERVPACRGLFLLRPASKTGTERTNDTPRRLMDYLEQYNHSTDKTAVGMPTACDMTSTPLSTRSLCCGAMVRLNTT